MKFLISFALLSFFTYVAQSAPCAEDSGFPETNPNEISYLADCSSNEYGNHTRLCDSEGVWQTIQNECVSCPNGYTSSSGSTFLSDCTDVNECAEDNGGCDSYSQCINTAGSRTCECLPGYELIESICSPNEKTAYSNLMVPTVRYLFNGNGLDSSSQGVNLNMTDITYTDLYQKSSALNQAAIFETGNPGVVTLSSVNINDRFSVEILFHLVSLPPVFTFFSLIPINSNTPFFSIQGSQQTQINLFSPKKVFRSRKILRTGRTAHLLVSIRNDQMTMWLNGEKLGTLDIIFPSSGDYYVSMGQNMNGYLDEVALYDLPMWNSQVPTLNSFYACTNTCPRGKTCFNSASAPSCV